MKNLIRRLSQKLNQNSTQSTGREGERLAAAFLLKQGYKIIKRNLHLAGGEIDLLAQAPSGTLVVVEVKTRLDEGIAPQVNLTPFKQKTLRRLAHAIADRYPQQNVRIDLVEVTLENYHINHLEDING